MTMPPSPKIYVRHRRNRRLYEAYLRHLTRPKWRSHTNAHYDADVPLSTPSFGSAVAWIRKNRHVINGVLLLLKLYPHVIRDDSLNGVWEFLEPYLEVCAVRGSRHDGGASELPVVCRSELSSPTFVEISFPVTPVSKLNINRSCCRQNTTSTRSSSKLRERFSDPKLQKRNSDIITLSSLRISSNSDIPTAKYRNTLYVQPHFSLSSSSQDSCLLAPPSVPMSPVSRYVESRDSRSVASCAPDVRGELPPVKPSTGRRTTPADQPPPSAAAGRLPPASSSQSSDDSSDSLRPTPTPAGVGEPPASGLAASLYTPTRYLVTNNSSLNHLQLVDWPPKRDDEGDGGENVSCLSEDDDELESSFLLNNANADIDLWSDTPTDGIDGELE